MTPRQSSPGAVAAAKALQIDEHPLAGSELELGRDAPGPPAEPRADQCAACGRSINLAQPVSHGLRGRHTCRTPAGVIPPYLDPTSDEERGAVYAYQQRRAGERRDAAIADPTRPF